MLPATESQNGTDVARNDCVVNAQRLSKQYRNGTQALVDVDLSIRKGELYGLIGPDGAGKTTAMAILAGVMQQTGGTVTILNQPPRQMRQGIGYLTQQDSLYPDLTVAENLRYEAGMREIPKDVFEERSEKYLRQLGLDQFSDRLASQLSGGMKQKLALCCTLISEPALLLLDEPSTGLDPIARQELWQVIETTVKNGTTVLISTAYLDEAQRCTRVSLLYEGQVKKTGTPAELENKLNSRLLEISTTDPERADNLLRTAPARAQGIVDVNLLGDRIEVLIQNKSSSQDSVLKILSDQGLPPKSVKEKRPNLDSVFVDCLRQEGLNDAKPLPLPKTTNDQAGSGKPEKGAVAIAAHGLSKRFQDFLAVKEISLDLHYGQIFALIGANGAGKTTTMKMLCGLLPPSSGEIMLGKEKTNLRTPETRRQFGYMSQKFTLYDSLTVLENLTFYATIYEVPRQHREEKIRWAIESCGLEDRQQDLVGSLPRGWKQRIAFGAAVLHEPTIIFLDEPTAGVDAIARRQLWSMIRELSRSGAAIVVSTHYLEEAEYCHRLGLMVSSEMIMQGSPSEIRGQHSSLEEAFIDIVQNRSGGAQ
jgi:ABC-2 type transport system ATP-binding protein